MAETQRLYQDNRASQAMDDFKQRKEHKQKKFEENNFGPPKPFDMSFIDHERTSYTMEENFSAYRLFCIMDLDNSGLISLRELRRVLTGTTARSTLSVHFDHPDVGIIWNLDRDNCVVIESIEAKSPASAHPEVIQGLMLLRVNNTPVTPYDPSSLQVLHKELIELHDDPMELEFVEPLFIINKFTTALDIEVYGVIYTAWLPLGAVNNFAVMEENIHWALVQAHPALGAVEVQINRKTRRVTFFCEEYPFRLMFSTGPNFQVSCRYCLGFNAEDYEEAFEHTGQDLVMDLNLNLPSSKIDILMEELFGRFDTDGSGEFQFEEFRDFYTKLLANDKCRSTLRAYATHRFRDKLAEKRRNEIYEERRAKARRRRLMKEKNGKIMEAQIQKRVNNQMLCYDGVVRRKYEFRREDQIRKRVTKVTGGAGKMIEKKESKYHPEVKELEKVTAFANRQKMKKKMKEQEIARKKTIHDLMEKGDERDRELKRAQRDAVHRQAKIHMAEMMTVLRAAYTKGFQSMKTGVSGIEAIGINQNVVISPALKIGMNLFGPNASVDDVDLEDLDAKKLHPTGQRYFFMRQRRKDMFDPSKRHPAFFGCDFSREDSRHSSLALGACRAILSHRMAKKVKLKAIKRTKSQLRQDEYDKLDITTTMANIISIIEAPSVAAKSVVHGAVSVVLQRICERVNGSLSLNEDSISEGSSSEINLIAVSESTDRTPHHSLSCGSNYTAENIDTTSQIGVGTFTGNQNAGIDDFVSPTQTTGSQAISQELDVHSTELNSSTTSGCSLHATQSTSIKLESEQESSVGDIAHPLALKSTTSRCSNESSEHSQSCSHDSSSEVSSHSETESEYSESGSDAESCTGSELGNASDRTDFDAPNNTLTHHQKLTVYSNLNGTLMDALSTLNEKFFQPLVLEGKDGDGSIVQGSTRAEEPSQTLQEGSITSSSIVSSKSNMSIYNNTAEMLVRVLLELTVDRVAHAKLPYGVDLFDGTPSVKISVKKKHPHRRKKGGRKVAAATTDEVRAYVRPPRREGLVYKRASIGAEGAGKLVISGGTSGNYSVASEGTVFNLGDVKPKNTVLCIHSIQAVSVHRENIELQPYVNTLATLKPFVSIALSNSVFKIEPLGCDVLSPTTHEDSICDTDSISTFAAVLFPYFMWSQMDRNLSKWSDFVVKNYQTLLVKFTDANESVICEGKITFDDLLFYYGQHIALDKKVSGGNSTISDMDLTNSFACDKPFDIPLTMKCTEQYGGVEIASKLRVTMDLNGGDYVFPDRNDEYWLSKRSQHWTTYPITPISTGIVRQKFKDIAKEYDRQMIVSPVVWGFNVRYKGDPKDEVKFIHPIFTNFSLVKKPTSKLILDEIKKQVQLGTKANPWKWKPGECLVCYDGQPGCPRCFNMPLKANGDPSRPSDFEYNPEQENRDAAAAKQKELKRQQKEALKIANRKALKEAGELNYDSDASNECSVDTNPLIPSTDTAVHLHTKLTTERALTLYRQIALHLLKVYVKVMPGGDLRELVVDPTDTIWAFHSMFKNHHELGSIPRSMVILPTTVGLYEMDAHRIPENEFLGELNTSYITLDKYGFNKRGSTLAVMFFPRYKQDSTIPLVTSFMRENMDVQGFNFVIPNIRHLVGIPEKLEEDTLQKNLVTIMQRQFHDQQIHVKAKYIKLAREYRLKRQQEADAKYKAAQAKRVEDDRLRVQLEKELEDKLKGTKGAERLARRETILRERADEVSRLADDKLKRDLERAMKTAERQRKLLLKRAESNPDGELSRSLSALSQLPSTTIVDSESSYTTHQESSGVVRGDLESLDESQRHQPKGIDCDVDQSAQDNSSQVEVPALQGDSNCSVEGKSSLLPRESGLKSGLSQSSSTTKVKNKDVSSDINQFAQGNSSQVEVPTLQLDTNCSVDSKSSVLPRKSSLKSALSDTSSTSNMKTNSKGGALKRVVSFKQSDGNS